MLMNTKQITEQSKSVLIFRGTALLSFFKNSVMASAT